MDIIKVISDLLGLLGIIETILYYVFSFSIIAGIILTSVLLLTFAMHE